MKDIGFNLVEMIDGEQYDSPCLYGNIVKHHACYCHHDDGPRKCPVWRFFGDNPYAWHNRGDWNSREWNGGCTYFRPMEENAE